MTTPEHTLVGILGAMAVGLHSRFGWVAVAFVAVVSNVPDLDGLPMLIDMERFESGHRVWGHNLAAIVVTTTVLALLQYRMRWIEGIGLRVARFLPDETNPRNLSDTAPIKLSALLFMGIAFQCIHLLCDITVSGGPGLSDWKVRALWPFDYTGFVYPLIQWGDPGPTIIMMLGVIGIARKGHAQQFAAITLTCLTAYMLFRGYTRGVITSVIP